MKQFRIRKDDKVMVIAGKDQGKIGKVLKVLHKHDSVVVEKVNVAKRHVKPNPYRREPGGIVDKEMPIHVSNHHGRVPRLRRSHPRGLPLRGGRQENPLLQEVQRNAVGEPP